jgi:hypothetical protein
MGCIPIVKRSPIDYLYADLPVAIVDEWSQITALNLQRWLERSGAAFDRLPLRQTLFIAVLAGADSKFVKVFSSWAMTDQAESPMMRNRAPAESSNER